MPENKFLSCLLKGFFVLICGLSIDLSAQNTIRVEVLDSNKPLPNATVYLDSLVQFTDALGQVEFSNLPKDSYSLKISFVGFKPVEEIISFDGKSSIDVRFDLEEESLSLNQMVVSGTRTNKRRLDSPVAVNILDGATFDKTQSNTLAEGICFQPGLRLETDCQTCNYTQLRMNGLAGSYSQILIDSRPVFSALMGLYSLEQIPANQIERIEVVKGGGSVLFGSNAIAGTVNIITKQPRNNSWSISEQASVIDGSAWENFLKANANIINEEENLGISLFASNQNRQEYDANGDGFSELPRIKNNTFGAKLFTQLSEEHRLGGHIWSIYEYRRGGNDFDLPADQADQSEERTHNILVGGVDYNFTPVDRDFQLQAYTSFQHTDRIHYTGIDQSDGWGTSTNNTLISGIQYSQDANLLGTQQTFTLGYDFIYDYIFDEIKGYDYLVDQSTFQHGIFGQADWVLSRKWSVLAGLRLNQHSNMEALAFTPRINLLYKATDKLQFRAGYAEGFKAPQAFESDLHIAFAGGGISYITVDPDLKEETSNSYSLSVDFNDPRPNFIYGFTVDGFITNLQNAFILEEIGTDENGNQALLRTNGGSSVVKGVSLEARFNINQKIQWESGFTLQSSQYEDAVAWSENIEGTKDYLRTPNQYGYFVLSFFPLASFNASLSGVYTGSMYVPHFGGAPEQDVDELVLSPEFFELNLKIQKEFRFDNRAVLGLSAGVKNIFNQYQSDFDTGAYRDSNYIYGPARPRSLFFSLSLGME